MVARYVPRQTQTVELARRAFAAGARTSTVEFLTGLDRCALFRYLTFEPGEAPKPGKRPDSPERFVKNASLATMVDASLAYALYREDRAHWPQPPEALVISYEHYARRRAPMGLSFDRVFLLAGVSFLLVLPLLWFLKTPEEPESRAPGERVEVHME